MSLIAQLISRTHLLYGHALSENSVNDKMWKENVQENMLPGLLLMHIKYFRFASLLEQGCLSNCLSVNEIHKIMKEGLILWNKSTSPANLT